MDQSIKAGIFGFALAVILTISLPISIPAPFDFLPTFIIAILVIYIFRLDTIKDGLIATFLTYIFSQGILGTLTLAIYYTANEPYTFTIDPYLILSPIISAVSTLIAAYIGVWLAKQRPQPQKQPSQPTDIPRDMQTV